MSEFKRFTRSVKHDKRHKQKRKIIFFGSLALLFFIIFISLILFGNKGNPKENEVMPKDVDTEQNADIDQETTDDSVISDVQKPKDSTLVPAEDPKEETEQDVQLEEIESDDNNIIKAYKGDWQPVGTEQEGPHTTSYDEGSADRIEIKRAAMMVTGIEEANMTEHWIGRGGEQQVIATVSDRTNEGFYRIYMQWIEGEGWQPTKVEELEHYS